MIHTHTQKKKKKKEFIMLAVDCDLLLWKESVDNPFGEVLPFKSTKFL